MKTHPITGMKLEDGQGHLPDDDQARRLHIPYIRATQGDKVAERMLLELDHAAANRADAWNEWRKKELNKIVADVFAPVIEEDVTTKVRRLVKKK